jgi:phage baseplate assembly protein W
LQRISGRDFVAAGGEALVRSCIAQILGTRPGELPWRPDFGVDLEAYRHRGGTRLLADALTNELAEAISTYEARVMISEASAVVDGNVIRVKVVWSVISGATEGNNVIIGPVQQEVSV